jgi:hypothetical protein
MLETLVGLLDTWLATEELAADIRARYRRRQLLTLLLGFLVVVGGTVVIGRLLMSHLGFAVIAAGSYFCLSTVAVLVIMKRLQAVRSRAGSKP